MFTMTLLCTVHFEHIEDEDEQVQHNGHNDPVLYSVSYLQVATDMVSIPKMRMSRFNTRGMSSSIPIYRRSKQD
jgi:pyruvate dehydrogenase complex dehydrogenase (E1) component